MKNINKTASKTVNNNRQNIIRQKACGIYAMAGVLYKEVRGENMDIDGVKSLCKSIEVHVEKLLEAMEHPL